MSDKQIKAIAAQRRACMTRLSRIYQFAEKIEQTEILEAANIRLAEARELASQIKSLDLDLLSKCPDEVIDTTDFENWYYAIEAKLGAWIRTSSNEGNSINLNETTIQNIQHQDLKLPKSIVPIFDGKYTEWQSFYDLFCANIHDRTNLTPSQKFQFLGAYMKGEASNLIKNFKITDANYYEALDKLRDRYNRKKHIVNAYLTTFFAQEQVQSSNVGAIKRLLDTSDEVLRGLKALGPAAEL